MILRALTLCLLGSVPATAQTCPELRFAQGASSGVYNVEVPGIGGMCLAIGVRPGQTVTIEPIGSANTWVSVSGALRPTDTRASFRTDRSRYEIYLTQKTRAVGSETFQLFVAIR